MKVMVEDLEFIKIMKLVAEFTQQTNTVFWRNVGEVGSSFTSPNHITLLYFAEEEIVGYVHLAYLGKGEWIISQALHTQANDLKWIKEIEELLKEKGGTRILGYALPTFPLRLIEKYGFKIERLIVSKNIN